MHRKGKGEAECEDELIQIWKELHPSEAYLQGWNECAGKFFVPTSTNIGRIRTGLKKLRRKTTDPLLGKVIDAIEADISFEEPQPVLDGILSAIYSHLVKEGVQVEHLNSLLSDCLKAIQATLERFRTRQVPVAVRVLTMYRLEGVVMILRTLRESTNSKELVSLCDKVTQATKSFVSKFEVEGFGQGTFEEVEKVFKEQGFDLRRKSFYKEALKDAFDYAETPEELEKKAIKWIDEEMPRFREVMSQLSTHYGCATTVESIDAAISKRYGLNPGDVVRLTREVRKRIQAFVSEDVGRIHPKYSTEVVETPSYLSGVIPTAAAQFFDTFTTKPYQHFFVTTDKKRDPITNVPQMIDTLVHEEYGHCVHHFNSAKGLFKMPRRAELIFTQLAGAITEGIAFNRELEFMEASKSLEKKKVLSLVERKYLKMLEGFGGVHLLNMEIEYEVRKWRIIRFLRVVGDVRVNTGSQTLPDFLSWAHKKTGISRSSMYYQLFPAHEGIFPGYATTYAVVGEDIREMESEIKDQRKRTEFSAYATSVGFPPRSLYNQKLRAFIRGKRNK